MNSPGRTRAFLEGAAYAKAWSLLRLRELGVQGAAGGQEGGNGGVSNFGKRVIILERDFSVAK